MATETTAAASPRTFSKGRWFSTGGVDCFTGGWLEPQWQFGPHWHPASPHEVQGLAEQQDALAWRAAQHDLRCGACDCRQGLALPHRQTFAPVQRHGPADCCWQQLLLPPLSQPHEAAGKPCAAVVTAASQISVRAAILLVIHMIEQSFARRQNSMRDEALVLIIRLFHNDTADELIRIFDVNGNPSV